MERNQQNPYQPAVSDVGPNSRSFSGNRLRVIGLAVSASGLAIFFAVTPFAFGRDAFPIARFPVWYSPGRGGRR